MRQSALGHDVSTCTLIVPVVKCHLECRVSDSQAKDRTAFRFGEEARHNSDAFEFPSPDHQRRSVDPV